MDIIKKPKVNVVMDASQYDMLQLCPQRYFLRYDRNKALPGKSDSLEKGTLVHVAAETYYGSLKSGAKYDYAVESALLKTREASVLGTELESKEVDNVLDTMESYFDYWRHEDQGLEILGVEDPFIYLLHEDDNIRIHMAGKIDLLVNTPKYTRVPYDHKSFSRSHEVNEMSNQFKNYCMATSSVYLFVNKIGFQKSLKPHEKFVRVPVSYDHLKLEQWKRNVVRVIMYYIDMKAEFLETGNPEVWTLNETSCDKFNRKCEYYGVCNSSGIEAKKFKLDAQYVDVEPWDVSKALMKSSKMIELHETK